MGQVFYSPISKRISGDLRRFLIEIVSLRWSPNLGNLVLELVSICIISYYPFSSPSDEEDDDDVEFFSDFIRAARSW
jgi:hypothetical protein